MEEEQSGDQLDDDDDVGMEEEFPIDSWQRDDEDADDEDDPWQSPPLDEVD